MSRLYIYWKSSGKNTRLLSILVLVALALVLVLGTRAPQGQFLEAAGSEALEPYLVKDIYHTVTEDAAPVNLTDVNGTLFFTVEYGEHAHGLWKSDGTEGGTVIVKGLLGPTYLTDVSGTLFFWGDDGLHGRELWVSDGTEAGTVLVKDLNPLVTCDQDGRNPGSGSYPCGSFPFPSDPWCRIDANGMLFFIADDGVHGREMWVSDGTEAGTVLVKDIVPGAGSSFPEEGVDDAIGNVGSTAFFAADDGVHGTELWMSDGMEAGTVLVKDIVPGAGSSSPTGNDDPFVNVGGTLFFVADDGVHGHELWVSDGTEAGTVMVKDIDPGSGASDPRSLTEVNGTLFFEAQDGVHGSELWVSDGTEAGTVMVKDIYPGSDSGWPRHLTAVGGTLFFVAYDDIHGHKLWKSDGTEAGTVLVPASYLSNLGWLEGVGSTLFFAADDGVHGTELWKSDGTEAGTVMVKDIYPGPGGPPGWEHPAYLTAVNGALFFEAIDGTHGRELWVSDGTEAGTFLVKDINAVGKDSSPRYLTEVNGTLFLAAIDGSHGMETWDNDGTELWKSDGTEAGTVLVKDINPNDGSEPCELTEVSGTLFFAADDGDHGPELWVSDGTEAGTVLVKDISSEPEGSGPYELTDVNGTLFFGATVQKMYGPRLWKSDGTEAGTVMVGDVGGPGYLVNVNGTLFFSGHDGSHGGELWVSDGTEAGTVMVKDINPFTDCGPMGGVCSSSPDHLTDVNGTLFFSADDGTHGRELWVSNGTEAGTFLVKDISPGLDGLGPSGLIALDGTLFFAADDGVHGYELWVSDGTEAGTVMVREINPLTSCDESGENPGSGSYPCGSSPYDPASVNGALFFQADDGTHGTELWVSDGTTRGTVLVRDINPGAESSFEYLEPLCAGAMVNVNGMLLFQADDGSHGCELWQSDGTEAGTLLVKDINPRVICDQEGELGGSEPCGSSPSYLTNVNGTLFFSADNGVHGRELWSALKEYIYLPVVLRDHP